MIMHIRYSFYVLVLLTGLLSLGGQSVFFEAMAQERSVFWIENDAIVRMNVDTREREVVFADSTVKPGLMTLDTNGERIYFTTGADIITNQENKNVARIDWTGENFEPLLRMGCGLDGPGAMRDMIFDISKDRLYILMASDCSGVLLHSNPDGSDVSEDLIDAFPFDPVRMALDFREERAYWTDFDGRLRRIEATDFGGTTPQDIILDVDQTPDAALTFELFYSSDIAINAQTGVLYWTGKTREGESGVIQRMNVDGTGLQTLLDGLVEPSDISLDVAGGWMFWMDRTNGSISRARLDGTEPEIIASDLDNPSQLALSFGNDGVFITSIEPVERPLEMAVDVYPNPTASAVTVSFELFDSTPVRIEVYDLLGRSVVQLASRIHHQGQHQVTWDASEASRGVYFIRLELDGRVTTRQVMVR